MLDQTIRNKIIKAQRDEISEYHLYKKLAGRVKKESDREALEKIAKEEVYHYDYFKKFSSQDIGPNRWQVFFYYAVSRLLGLNFGVRLMERSENAVQKSYEELRTLDGEMERIIGEEKQHENKMLDLIDQEGLAYTGSVVLGLSDALVELTGVLAGLTLALQHTGIVAIAGLITGIAATLSMAASEYLSTKEEQAGRDPWKAAIYTGIAYIGAVILLIFPYFVFHNPYVCLAIAVGVALVIVLIFTFYISVARNLSFKKRFTEMAILCLSVAALNFFIGFLVQKYLHVQV